MVASSFRNTAFLKDVGYKAIAIAIAAHICLIILRHDIYNKVGYRLGPGAKQIKNKNFTGVYFDNIYTEYKNIFMGIQNLVTRIDLPTWTE